MPNSPPERMQVVEISRPGGPEVLKLAMRPLPQPKPGRSSSALAAAGVNRPDCLQRAGTYAPPPGASDLPGLEVAGTVVGLGEGVTGGAKAIRSAPSHRVVDTRSTVSRRLTHCLPATPGLEPDPGGVPAGDVLHRLDQRI